MFTLLPDTTQGCVCTAAGRGAATHDVPDSLAAWSERYLALAVRGCHFGRLLDGFFGCYLAPRLYVMVSIGVSFREVNA